MIAYFTVTVDQLEEDADLDLIREAIEEALAKRFPFHDTAVGIEDQ